SFRDLAAAVRAVAVHRFPASSLLLFEESSTGVDPRGRGFTHWDRIHRVSDNAGAVKHFLSVLLRALRRARHFALVEGSALPNQGPLVIRFRSGTQSDPCISSVTRSIMIITSNSPGKGSGIPTQLLDVLLHTIAMSGLSRVRTELSQLLVIPFLPHHPIEANRELSRHRDLGDFPSSPQRHVTVLTPPFGEAPHRHLRRFH